MAIAGEKHTIHIRLLDEGTDVFRPVTASKVGENIYLIPELETYDPDDEVWEFLPGTMVSVEPRRLSTGEVLVAVKQHDVP